MLKNPNALQEDYIPKKLKHREEEYKKLKQETKFFIQGLGPSNLLIIGGPGTGKTVTTIKALNDSNVNYHYCVCGKTDFQTVQNLLGRRLVGNSLAYCLIELDKLLGDDNCVVVLDEIDWMLKDGKGNDLLYFLTRRKNTWVIAISNMVTVFNFIQDGRVKSSFNPKHMFFNAYSADELIDILRQRADEAFEDASRVISDEVFNYIAALAVKKGGDARYAIDLLRYSTKEMIKQNNKEITKKEVDSAIEELEEDYICKGVIGLREPEQLLLALVACSNNGSIRAGELVKQFNKVSSTKLTRRRLSDILSDLKFKGYLDLQRKGQGRGRGVQFIVKLSKDINRQKVIEALAPTFSWLFEGRIRI